MSDINSILIGIFVGLLVTAWFDYFVRKYPALEWSWTNESGEKETWTAHMTKWQMKKLARALRKQKLEPNRLPVSIWGQDKETGEWIETYVTTPALNPPTSDL